ncbi:MULTISPECIES: cytochrome b [Azorhizobium]|uniref:Cytochrome b561 n=1 Tax=Azorhizobium caulinodans (strain ATCC 43989 / DSM 5975 / JCM 20966 / LMG 6465 / NBRC 14845 / NCIMB 13405 / ORS 571) TaxID=438753 RepID=A8ILN5_AZOC5|nr:MULTISPECIES: cytochrome b [Azorhizobium]TDU00648.1 cytochrome b561 [Azorhizobium sp. AG788]BAF90056.1 cytochrome b561 [Azorhizobium caulinodans ORS 571]
MQPVQRYPNLFCFIHWATVALIAIIYGLTYVRFLFERGTPLRAMVWWLHISFGLVLLAFIVARVVARHAMTMPGPSAALSPLVHRASQAVHVLLYALLVLTPVVGVYLAFLRGDAVTLFGLFTIPSPVAVDRTFARQVVEVHEWLANGLVAVALVHGAAAIGHHFVLKDDVLTRMLPRR